MLDDIGFTRRFIIDESLVKAGDELRNIAEMCSDKTLDDASAEEVERLKSVASDMLTKIGALKKDLGFNYFDEVD